MNRIDQLVHDITLSLKENDMDKETLFSPDDRYQNDIWLTNLMNLTAELSDITIEHKEDVSDVWWEVSYYIRVEWSTKWYNLILSSSAEDMDIQSIEDLANVIYSYEQEAHNLLLKIREWIKIKV